MEKNSTRIEYLEEARKNLSSRIEQLEQKIEEKPSDFEREAKQASKKTAEFRNKTEERLTQAIDIHDKLVEKESQIDKLLTEVVAKHTQVIETNNDLLDKRTELTTLLTRIKEVLDEYPDIESEIERFDDLSNSIQENASKATTTYRSILTKKTEIDELHREILGYEEESEDGSKIVVDGLKGELKSAFESLDEKADTLESQINNLNAESKKQYEDFLTENQAKLDKVKSNHEKDYNSIIEQIQSLLPTALTAGLSSAFVKKKEEEEKLYSEYKKNFRYGIIWISLSALLPITVSIIYLFTQHSTLTETLERAPTIILAFLPLYIPLIWTTVSANKKVNLSKRLIEEYSHKQVLSMTIEGLSKQIENIDDPDMSEELRIKLLNSFLTVTGENPGKLISNYQKSDNPIVNFFDREKKKDKTIVETMEDSTKNIIEKASDEIEGSISSDE